MKKFLLAIMLSAVAVSARAQLDGAAGVLVDQAHDLAAKSQNGCRSACGAAGFGTTSISQGTLAEIFRNARAPESLLVLCGSWRKTVYPLYFDGYFEQRFDPKSQYSVSIQSVALAGRDFVSFQDG